MEGHFDSAMSPHFGRETSSDKSGFVVVVCIYVAVSQLFYIYFSHHGNAICQSLRRSLLVETSSYLDFGAR